MDEVKLKPIGYVRSPFRKANETPIQPSKSREVGEVVVFEEYEKGLKDITGFSHLIILYLFYEARTPLLLVRPFLVRELKGVFATRHPQRPNPIGLSVVELLERNKNVLKVKGVDVVDGTPLIDIKPYIPAFGNERKSVKIGWLTGKLRQRGVEH